MKFEDAFLIVSDIEGKISNHEEDKGGYTNAGISSVYHPDLDVDAIAENQEKKAAFFWQNYWQPAGCDELPWPVSLVVFDGAVNHGPETIGQLLQQAANQTGAELKEDGIVGPKTIKAALGRDPLDLARRVLMARGFYYAQLVRRDHSQAVFIGGWVNRLKKLLKEVDSAVA
jgi:lysozyme family protein